MLAEFGEEMCRRAHSMHAVSAVGSCLETSKHLHVITLPNGI